MGAVSCNHHIKVSVQLEVKWTNIPLCFVMFETAWTSSNPLRSSRFHYQEQIVFPQRVRILLGTFSSQSFFFFSLFLMLQCSCVLLAGEGNTE